MTFWTAGVAIATLPNSSARRTRRISQPDLLLFVLREPLCALWRAFSQLHHRYAVVCEKSADRKPSRFQCLAVHRELISSLLRPNSSAPARRDFERSESVVSSEREGARPCVENPENRLARIRSTADSDQTGEKKPAP